MVRKHLAGPCDPGSSTSPSLPSVNWRLRDRGVVSSLEDSWVAGVSKSEISPRIRFRPPVKLSTALKGWMTRGAQVVAMNITEDAHTWCPHLLEKPQLHPATSLTCEEILSSPSKLGLGDEVTQPPMVIWRHIAKEADTYEQWPAGGRDRNVHREAPVTPSVLTPSVNPQSPPKIQPFAKMNASKGLNSPRVPTFKAVVLEAQTTHQQIWKAAARLRYSQFLPWSLGPQRSQPLPLYTSSTTWPFIPTTFNTLDMGTCPTKVYKGWNLGVGKLGHNWEMGGEPRKLCWS